VKVVERVCGRTGGQKGAFTTGFDQGVGPDGSGRETGDLVRIMGKLIKRENSYPRRLVKDSIGKSIGYYQGWADPIQPNRTPGQREPSGGVFLATRSALEAGVWFAVIEQVTDAVHGVLENRGGSEHNHADRGIDERDDVEGGDKTGDLAYEAEVFECFHGDQGAVSTPARGRIALVGFKRPLTPTGDAFGRILLPRWQASD